MKTILLSEVAQHDKEDDLWIILHGKVYDLTQFLPEHTGGQHVILQHAGKDATTFFDSIHSPDIIERFLTPDVYMGEVDPGEKNTAAMLPQEETEEEKNVRLAREDMPRLEEVYNSFDFESIARSILKKDAWYYFSSGAQDEISMRENHNAFHRLWLRPRVMMDVSQVDTTTTLLGTKVSMPLYISATAMNKMAHPDAEKVLTRAAGVRNVIQMIPTLSACSLEEIVNARIHKNQPQWFQLYVDKDRTITKRIVQQVEAIGIRGLFITVDLATVGRREKYLQHKLINSQLQNDGGQRISHRERKSTNSKRSNSTTSSNSNQRGSIIDPSLTWTDITWFKSITKMPIILKGIQRWEDAVEAYKRGCAGVVLSNHGGRQLDFAPSPIEILPEVIDALKREGCDPKKDFDVYIDGGIRRGSDIFKAIALGAKGVGIGRPSLYAMACYGDQGVERLLELFQNELCMCMQLMGVSSIEEIKSDMVDIRNLKDHFVANPVDYLAKKTYERMYPRGNISKL
ncbi:FMN-dependent dehydrogenase-domain-containing protein [Phascolomyces articulosus]|uniref:L-lactate dehydrogenase (cytochrome) n=1 Tax=Phascolomyces articulosus TaxID=60185 RepID=A0AAD5JP65_9FUNG|nr:FMN-dependent dehydrogenase-domain-containing protein [Phascolomyces articulosus]